MESRTHDTLRGNLYKWTNYLRGYQKRWFVLQNGFVSYYRNQAEMAHTCRGTINLVNALVESTGSTTFTISNSSNQTFHLRAANEADKKKWVSTLLSAKSKALALKRNGDDSDTYLDGDDYDECKHPTISPDDAVRIINQTLTKLETHLSDLQQHHETLTRKSSELQRVLSEMETARDPLEMSQHFNVARERMTIFKVVSLAMVSSCTEFMMFSRSQVQRWRRLFNSQNERCGLLEQMIEELAKQLRQLELLVKHNNPQASLTLAESCAGGRLLGVAPNPSNFPGQPVLVDHNQLRISEGVQCSSASPTDFLSTKNNQIACAKPAPKPVTQKLKTAATADKPESVFDSSDEDFYDAEEVGSEFSVFLPSTSYVQDNDRDKQKHSILRSGETPPKDDDSSPRVLCSHDDDSSLSIGTDLAYEYESDIEFAEEDIYRKADISGSRGVQGLREAQVIQTRQKQEAGRTGTLVPAVDRYLEQEDDSATPSSVVFVPKREITFTRRTSIPPRPNYSLNLWSIMKNCIGKELTKIPMPVNFSEPLSMLQRLTEDFEYSACLDQAARCTDSLEQMVHVAAFTVSAYATTAVRVNKPFNPLLGETYECDRTDDLGWRSLAEQVSHHPPKCALHCESNSWYCWFEFSMNTKFRGKYLQINPIGTCHLIFRRTGHHYTWKKIPMTVHNIIVGRLWIDNSGEMDIVNHHTGEKCHLSYKAYSYFSNDTARRVTGAVTDKLGSVRYVLDGTWDGFMEYSPVINSRTARGGKPVLETGPPCVLWRCKALPPGADQMYFFTSLAVQLNQEEEGVCPTDCRFRPDQRLMELGRWDEANREKIVLEEKQRARRRKAAIQLAAQSSSQPNKNGRGSIASDASDPSQYRPSLTSAVISSFLDVVDNAHKPLWFVQEVDADTGTPTSVFNGKYWNCKARGDWSMCPDIY